MCSMLFFGVLTLVLNALPSETILIIAPEDVSTGLAAIYGFSPRLVKGNDHRFGFGFRFGNHADFQVMYELGPQTLTRPLNPIRVRSASYRQRVVRRRPLIEFLLKTGLLDLKEEGFEVELQGNVNNGYGYDEPR